MTSKLVSASISASVLAIAAFAASSSFAEGNTLYLANQITQNTPSTLTRAEVQAELAQARRAGYNASFASDAQGTEYTPVKSASSRTRAEVQAELSAAGPRASAAVIEHSYPVVQ